MPRNESSRSAGKRPMRAMTPQEKMDAIGRVHTGESKAAVARDIGVPESTLRGWCKAEDKIRTQLNNVRATGNYEHILTSSSDNSDNSRPGSSSRSTPTQNNMGMSASGAEKASEEPEAGPAPKRMKMDNNLTSAAVAAAININNMNNMSTSARASTVGSESVMFNPYLYNLLATDPNKTLAFLNTLLKGDTLLPFTGYTSPATNLLADSLPMQRTNGAMTATMTMANMLSNSNNVHNNLLNGKRSRYNVPGLALSTADLPSQRAASRRQNSQSPNAEKPSASITPQPVNHRSLSPIPSTSVNDGSAVTNTPAKVSKDCKKLNAIIDQLQQQQNVAIAPVPVCNVRNLSNANHNNVVDNNHVDNNHVDNELNPRSPNTLPPGFSDMLMYCTKLVEWLQTYGTPICTFQQVTQIRTILDNMMNWATRDNEPRRKPNGTS